MIRSSKGPVLRLIPASQPVKKRFVEESIATLRSRHKRGQTRENAEEFLFRIQAGSSGDLFSGKRFARGRDGFQDLARPTKIFGRIWEEATKEDLIKAA